MNIYVKNRAEIVNGFMPDGHAILISISDVGSDAPEPNPDYTEQLQLFFDDADQQIVDGVTIINEDDAKDILKMVEDYKGIVDHVVVNCEAGQSRSAGCAAALSYIYNGTDKGIIKTKPLYNRLVYRTVMNEHFGKYC
jgi:predicted protein tyrosine phosphatase